MRAYLRISLFALSAGCALLLSGCANSFEPGQVRDTDTAQIAIKGDAYGGFFPIAGAHIFLFSPATTVGGASTSLISSNSTGYTVDTTSGSITNGAGYITTSSTGTFNFTSTCTVNQPVYIYSAGGIGTTGGSYNPQIGLLSVVGICPASGSVDSFSAIHINELTTVAAAYALAGFATDPGHVSYTGTSLGRVGLLNAFNTASNMISQSVVPTTTGFSTTTLTANSTGTLPQTTLNSLADIIVACVNSANSASATTTGCNNLRKYATSDGAVGTGPTAPAIGSFSADAPGDTATALVNIAHHPFANTANLFTLQGANASAVYRPALAAAPASYMVEIVYTGSGLANHNATLNPHVLAVDGSGNIWVNNAYKSNVSKFSPLGVPLSGTTGFTSTGANCKLTGTTGNTVLNSSIAIDLSGNAWIGFTQTGDSICELSSTGAFIFALPFTPKATTSYDGINDIAFDSTGNAWLTDSSGNAGAGSLVEVGGSSHTIITTKTGNGLSFPFGLAIDAPSTFSGHTGNIWVADASGSADSVFTSTGANASFSPTSAGSAQGSTGEAIDSSGNVWSLSYGSAGYLSKTAPNGATGSSYTYPSQNNENSLSIDGAGNVWVQNFDSKSYNVISEVNNSGVLLTPAAGFLPIGGVSGNPGNSPDGVAVDGSGNLWFVMQFDATMHQLVGASIPVATPIAYGTANNKLGSRP